MPSRGLAQEVALAGGAVWTRLTCTGSTPLGPAGTRHARCSRALSCAQLIIAAARAGPMVFNRVLANLSAIELRPAVAPPDKRLAPLDVIAATVPNAVAGINGGYFFRVDKASFLDEVCWGKSKRDAELPANSSAPNDGVGDTLVVIGCAPSAVPVREGACALIDRCAEAKWCRPTATASASRAPRPCSSTGPAPAQWCLHSARGAALTAQRLRRS
jgi:hypothetical protein